MDSRPKGIRLRPPACPEGCAQSPARRARNTLVSLPCLPVWDTCLAPLHTRRTAHRASSPTALHITPNRTPTPFADKRRQETDTHRPTALPHAPRHEDETCFP
ncbi:hypothetical protein BC628DRAFT_593466 [Trametes gibbosa]|nr:hypothetical protein BC628DRAFT_593466 [Trametes gibbosa]